MDQDKRALLQQINCLMDKLDKNQSCQRHKPEQTCNSADPPSGKLFWQKVTLDGRKACVAEFALYDEVCPKRVPPWARPRIPSVELKSSELLSGCTCWRRNGLQADCRRTGCRGHPECLRRPLPECCPAHEAPVTGVRKANLSLGARDRCPY